MYAKRLAQILGRGWLAFAGLAVAGVPAGATPLLSEVFYDAVGADNGHGFVEIAGDPGADLAGYRLVGVNGANGAPGPVVELVGAIGPHGLFLLADVDPSGASQTAGADQYANFDFQNGPDSVQLFAGNVVADALAWGVFGPGEFPAGEGVPAPDAPPGSSLARPFANHDSNDNAADFVVLATPTPGDASFAAIPEPGTGALLALGLGALVRCRASPGTPTGPSSLRPQLRARESGATTQARLRFGAGGVDAFKRAQRAAGHRMREKERAGRGADSIARSAARRRAGHCAFEHAERGGAG